MSAGTAGHGSAELTSGEDQLGAYGFRLHGLPAAERWMQPQPADARVLHVIAVRAEPHHMRSRVNSTSADVALLGGGRLLARRAEGMVRYALPAIPPDADLLHPYLAPGAALASQWRGREALHAGVFATGGGAVLLFGGKEAGKSTTLAWLARSRGVAVIADDLAVIVDGHVLPGPRCIDLRAGARTALGAAVRDDERVRVTLPEAPSTVPVAGSAVLVWGDAVSATTVPPSERLSILARQRSYPGLPGDELALLELAALPMFTLVRPYGSAGLAIASDALLRLIP